MKGLIIGTIAVTFILMPVLALLLIYIEGGLMGVAMYIAYIVSTFIVIQLPLIGIKLLKGDSI